MRCTAWGSGPTLWGQTVIKIVCSTLTNDAHLIGLTEGSATLIYIIAFLCLLSCVFVVRGLFNWYESLSTEFSSEVFFNIETAPGFGLIAPLASKEREVTDSQTKNYLFSIVIHCTYMLFGWCLPTQSERPQKGKWDQRRKNKEKSDKKKALAQIAQAKKTLEDLKKKQQRRKLHHQSGFEDVVNFTLDIPDTIMDVARACWIKLREIGIAFPSCVSFLKTKCSWIFCIYESFKGFTLDQFISVFSHLHSSECLSELVLILQLLVTIGFLRKMRVSYGGCCLIALTGLKRSTSVLEICDLVITFLVKYTKSLYTLYKSGDWENFIKRSSTEYDEEYAFLVAEEACQDIGRCTTLDTETYDRRIFECIGRTTTLLNGCKSSERGYYTTRLNKLKNIQVSRALAKKENIRIKPYGILLYGESGVGKSAIVNALLRYVLQVNGKDYSPGAIITLNQEDKFQSEFMTHHKGVILDDICNCALDKTDGSPTTPIIMFLNQVPMAALNPNAEMKGKIMIEPDVVCGTTNVKDLLSNELSNEPLSINRRFEVTITQTVKPQYRKKGTTMLDNNKIRHMATMRFPTYATFTVEEPYYPEDSTGNLRGGSSRSRAPQTRAVAFRPLKHNGRELVNIEIDDLLLFLREDSMLHFAKQCDFVNAQKNMKEAVLCCHYLPYEICDQCTGDPDSSENEICIHRRLKSSCADCDYGLCDDSSVDESVQEVFENQSGLPGFGLDLLFRESLHKLVDCIEWGLGKFYSSAFGRKIILWQLRQEFFRLTWMACAQVFGFSVILYWLGISFECPQWGAILIFSAWRFNELRLACAALYEREYLARTTLSLLHHRINTQCISITKFLRIFGGVGAFVIFVHKLYLTLMRVPTKQAAPMADLQPDAKSYHGQTEFWDTTAVERRYLFGDAGASEKSETISHDLLVTLMSKKLLQLVKRNNREFCNAVPLRSNVLLIPNHIIENVTVYVDITTSHGHHIRGNPLSKEVTQRIPGTDFAVWYVPSAGAWRDLVEYYPLEIEEDKRILVTTVFNHHGVPTTYPEMMATRGRVFTTSGTFSGLNYTFPVETFGGLCMATLIGKTRGVGAKHTPFIAGHHLAGKGTKGAAGFLTRTQIYAALEKLEAKGLVVQSHSSVPLQTRMLGMEFGPLHAPHVKCPTRELPSTAKIEVHGGHNLPVGSPSSAVVTSVISAAVERVMDIPKQHGPPPEIGDVRHKLGDLLEKVDTASEFDMTLLQKAYVDFGLNLTRVPAEELAKLGKIDLDVNLAGKDGVLGLNPMNFSTSVGFPLSGPKTRFATKSGRFVPGISCPRDLDPMVLSEMEVMEATLARGERINTVFKGSLKDEPVKIGKDKVRVFAAANMAFTLLVRKYYLTLSALVQRNRAIFECAVGVVVQSPEWGELYKHIGKYGWDRCVAGDYKKYDGRMSAHCMFLAFKLLLELAKKSGKYDTVDLRIMTGIATEITYPTYDYFGTLVTFCGSNPSGHPLTVVINSLVNSLYIRYTYYVVAHNRGWWRTPLFSDVVALMTYGDDNIMTVKKGYEAFNHTAIVQALGKVGITYTMADKEQESKPFIHLSEASFLKHFAVEDKELGVFRSPVEYSSLAKMLHTHKLSKVLTMEESSAEAIQNVALKYFEFGREEYELRRSQLERVAAESGIAHMVGNIPDYDERLSWYREKFMFDTTNC